MEYKIDPEEYMSVIDCMNNAIDAVKEIAILSIQNDHVVNLKRLDIEERRLALEERKYAQDIETAKTIKADKVVENTKYMQSDEAEVEVEVKAEPAAEEPIYDIHHYYFPEPKLTEIQSIGRDELLDMVTVWLKGFRVDGVEQPDRGEYMIELSNDGKRAGQVISYCRAVGGLTKACWNICHHLVHEQEEIEDYDLDSLNAEEIRYLAANITQVASCHLGFLADEFEYPNPIAHMK